MRICVMGNVRSAHTQRWARAYARLGHDVHVLSIRSETIPGVTVHPVFVGPANSTSTLLSFFSYVRLLLTARRRLRRMAPDVVHAHYTVTHGVIGAAAGYRPVVVSAWGRDVVFPNTFWPGPVLRALNRYALRRATAVTSTSAFMVPHIQRLAGRQLTIHHIPFGVDLTQFAPEEGSVREGFTVGFVKHLKPKYAPDDLLEAVALMKPRPRGLRVVMAGEGPLLGDLRARAERLNIGGIVEFVGNVPHDEVPDLMRTFDVLVNPSVDPSESFGVVLLEAAATGIPVVATDVGGISEVALPDRTAILVPPRRPDLLADALNRLAADGELRDRLGSAGRAYAAAQYQWKENVASMLDVLASTAGRPG